MWIESINIHGFGIFNDFRVDNLSNGLIVFLGDNEAGKSTLMAFIRQILFGFPRKGAKNRRQYPLLRGGRFGGILKLRMANGDIITVKRHEGPQGGTLTIYKNDEIPGGIDMFPDVLDASREDLYHNIFAFSLDEMQNLETLENEKINAIIYSASMGTVGSNLVEVNKRLNKNMDELFKPGGSKPKVNQILKEIKELQVRLEESQKSLSEYDEKHAEREYKEKELNSLENELNRLKERNGENDLLSKTLGDWIELQKAHEQLAELPKISSFPPDGLLRLNDIVKDIEQANNQIKKLSKKHEEYNQNLSEIDINQELIEIGPQLKELIEGKLDYEKAKKDLPERQSEIHAVETALNAKLTELVPDWDIEQMVKTDTSIQVRDEVRDYQKKLDSADEELKQIQNDQRQIQKRLNECAIKQESAKNVLNEFEERLDSRSGIREIPLSPAFYLAGLAVILGFIFSISLNNIVTGIVVSILCFLFAGGYLLLRKKLSMNFLQQERQHKQDEFRTVEEELTRIKQEHVDINKNKSEAERI